MAPLFPHFAAVGRACCWFRSYLRIPTGTGHTLLAVYEAPRCREKALSVPRVGGPPVFAGSVGQRRCTRHELRLLDEPEAHWHPVRERQLLHQIEIEAVGSQFIVATHSLRIVDYPDALDDLSPRGR